MRHIPEEELHAYLDQALSRSQCVEIECHLARCIRCRHERDRIAALRDRTTALLGLLAPAARPRPSFAELALQARGRQATAQLDDSTPTTRRRTTWLRYGSRAAGVALAIAAGWSARGFLPADDAGRPTDTQFALAPDFRQLGDLFGGIQPERREPVVTEPAPVSAEPDPGWHPDPIERTGPRRAPAVEPAVTPLALTVSTLEAADAGADFPTSGVWRTVSWDEAAALTGDAIPRIQGLPVVEIQVQRTGADERPLIMVAHQDSSGRIIRSIEGPAERLAELLAEVIERTQGGIQTSRPLRTTSQYVGGATGPPRRSIRVVTLAGRLDADALNTLSHQITTR